MNVVALFRVSTERQASEGASLDAQQRTYRDLAAKNGWTTVAEFKGAESATQAASDRRVLQQVLGCIREQSPDAVYVHEQSRLTRGDELEVAMLFRELKERRINIIVNGVVRDLGSIDERFMVGIQSLVDRTESERIKERMKRGKTEKAKRGLKNCGPAPFGYRNPLPGQAGRGTLQIVEGEAAIVRRVFGMAVAGKAVGRIAQALNGQGVASPRGGQWGKTTIKNLLQNPAYIGTAASGVWTAPRGTRRFKFDLNREGAIVVTGAHAPIVDRAAWDAVNGRVKMARTCQPRLLTGLLHLNGAAFGSDYSRRTVFYCAPRGLRGLPRVEAHTTDAAVWDAFVSLASAPEFVARLLEEGRNPRQEVLVAQEIEYLTERIGKVTRRRDRLIDMRADGEIDRTVYAAKKDEADRQIEQLQAQLGEQRAKANTLDGRHAPRIVKAVQVLLAGRTKLTAAQKRAILRSIVRRVDVAVEATGHRQARDAEGRVTGAAGPRWAIRSIAFRLALPSESDAPGGDVGGRAADECAPSEAAGFEPFRDRRLDTAPWSCDQVTVTVEGRDLAVC